MSTSLPQPYPGAYRLKVSNYDRVSSMLIALLILLGAVVLVLLIVWLTNKIFIPKIAVPPQIVELGEGDDALAGGMELQGPTLEEIGMETDLDVPTVQNTLAAIADAVGDKLAMLDDPAVSEDIRSGRGGGSSGHGRGVGSGGGAGTARNWEVRFIKGNTRKTYARQLDFFGIELGVLAPGNKVEYAYNLSKDRPDSKTGVADQEKRYYLTWRGGELQAADRELLASAGVPARRRIILKFLPPAVEGQLAQLERNYAGKTPGQIRRTRFGIRHEGSGYAFYVLEQTYR